MMGKHSYDFRENTDVESEESGRTPPSRLPKPVNGESFPRRTNFIRTSLSCPGKTVSTGRKWATINGPHKRKRKDSKKRNKTRSVPGVQVGFEKNLRFGGIEVMSELATAAPGRGQKRSHMPVDPARPANVFLRPFSILTRHVLSRTSHLFPSIHRNNPPRCNKWRVPTPEVRFVQSGLSTCDSE
jgi:hypothetical protein